MKKQMWLGVIVVAALMLSAQVAMACGGMFCAQPPPTPAAPEPVDQNAERIIFEVAATEITAHVQIQYMGVADDFAWVIPVPDVPEVGESDPDIFEAIDAMTRLQVMLPQSEACPQQNFGDSGGGVGCASSDASPALAGGDFNDRGPQEANNGVVIFDRDFTENFEFVVVGAENTMTLVTWLNNNGYNVSENMTPVMDPYNSGTGKFLALKLRAGKDVNDIQPIKMTYPGNEPMIPIQLTAVAAQPLMGIQVWIVSDVAFEPKNFTTMRPDVGEILFDAESNTNYFEWVARASDANDGKLFVQEFVGPLGDIDSDAPPIAGLKGRYVSRYYTRMSPHHMTEDPMFEVAQNPRLRVSRVLDLADQRSLYICQGLAEDRLPSACAFNYCGRNADCVVADGQAACVCGDNEVAQPITGPDGARHVTCVPARNELGVTDEAVGVGGAFDPCNNYECGDGTCAVRGGFPSCECNTGAAACAEEDGTVVCMPASGPTFGPGAGSESSPALASTEPRPETLSRVPLSLALLFPIGVIAVWRRRRRS